MFLKSIQTGFSPPSIIQCQSYQQGRKIKCRTQKKLSLVPGTVSTLIRTPRISIYKDERVDG